MGTSGNAKRTPASRESDPSVSYDEFKEFEGRKYTGMKVGRSHRWHYEEGDWKETKITPDLWQIGYAVNKRRAGRAPEGSGVPVGTEYHWYVLAHQNVQKLNANEYTTSLSGLKFKVAHRRADSGKWSAPPKTQRRRMIRFLQDVIADLERQGEEEEAAKATAAKEPARKSTTKKAAAKKASPKKTSTKKAAAKKAAEEPRASSAQTSPAKEPAKKTARKTARETQRKTARKTQPKTARKTQPKTARKTQRKTRRTTSSSARRRRATG
jgi:hypothetical protein